MSRVARRVVVVCLLLILGAGLIAVSPYGAFGVPLAAACLWPWPKIPELGLQRRDLVWTGFAISVASVIATWLGGSQFDGQLLHRGDFQTYWFGAVMGTRLGWSHLFDSSLQARLWPEVAGSSTPFLPYLNTPPQAWVLAPFLWLPYTTAYALWIVLMTVVLGAVVVLVSPRPRLPALSVLTLGLWVIPYTLASGENAVLQAFAVVACWRLLEGRREGWAGIALALVLVRPTATFALPLAVLLAGYRRTFFLFLIIAVVVAIASAITLGPSGIGDFIRLGQEVRQSHPRAIDMTIGALIRPTFLAFALGSVLAIGCLFVAWRAGRQPATIVATGVLASLFLTPYIHFQDFVTVLAAAGVVAATTGRSSFGVIVVALLVLAPPAMIFGGRWELLLLVVELSWLAWLAWSLRAGNPKTFSSALPMT